MSASLSTWRSLGKALTSWRLGAVVLLSFSSGLPLGLVLKAIPFWMQQAGIDIRTIGLITAAQAPYTFKFVWSPLMDRYAPARARKRAWIAFGQVALAISTAGLCLLADEPVVFWVATLTLLISLASATQDIAVDAYTVEVLRPEEQSVAVGARVALYRAAMFVGGALVVTLGPTLGWRWVYASVAAIHLAFVVVTALAPEPERPVALPVSLRAAIWEPFVGFFKHSRALEIAAFLFLYKWADNMAGALVSPFLGTLGYDAFDVGVASGTVGLVATLLGTFIGGLATQGMGLGRALWVFGLLQALSNVGYALIADMGVNRPAMYTAMAVEAATTGMGTGAFSVLLLRLTERRFSATQYALFTSIFALSRTVSGPPAGALIDALGWRDFFLFTIVLAVPGLVMLNRFVPWRARELPASIARDGALDAALERSPTHQGPGQGQEEGQSLELGKGLGQSRELGRGELWRRALVGGLLGTAVAYLTSALLLALKEARAAGPGFEGFALWEALLRQFRVVSSLDWLNVVGPPLFGVAVGLGCAAYAAARAGRKPVA